MNFEEFTMRLDYTFESFPDVHFEIQNAISDGDDVAITRNIVIKNNGVIEGLVHSNKAIRTNGSTKYHFNKGKIFGHTLYSK